MNIQIIEQPPQELVDFLNQKIVDFNVKNRELNQRYPIAVTVNNSDNEVIAGAYGVTFGHWLQLNILWVNEEFRGEDYGSKLLNQIETAAKERGCHYCLLDTLDFQAMPFYKKHGYQVNWTQENYPLTGCKYFMSKTLTST